jgi:Ca2+-binding RTX toxin-like protein
MASSFAYLTQTELQSTILSDGNFTASNQQIVIDVLKADGYFPTPTTGGVWVESTGDSVVYPDGGLQAPPVGYVHVLDLTGQNVSIDDSTNANLNVVLQDTSAGGGSFATGASLYVGGSTAVTVVLGDSAFDAVTLSGLASDTVYAGSGTDDIANNGDAASQIFGGSGADTLFGGTGADTLTAGSGDNTWLEGGTGAGQNLVGGSGYDVIWDMNNIGSDSLVAGTGNDYMQGYGSDTLDGGIGNDTLYGGTSSLLVSGTTAAGQENQLVSGSTASTADSLQGGAGDDSLYGGLGNDTLTAGSGANWLLTDANQTSANGTLMEGDTLVGGSSSDTVFVVQGLEGQDTGNDTVDAGSGTNALWFQNHSVADFAAAQVTPDGSGDYTIAFTDGQTVQDNGVTDLFFGQPGASTEVKLH